MDHGWGHRLHHGGDEVVLAPEPACASGPRKEMLHSLGGGGGGGRPSLPDRIRHHLSPPSLSAFPPPPLFGLPLCIHCGRMRPDLSPRFENKREDGGHQLWGGNWGATTWEPVTGYLRREENRYLGGVESLWRCSRENRANGTRS